MFPLLDDRVINNLDNYIFGKYIIWKQIISQIKSWNLSNINGMNLFIIWIYLIIWSFYVLCTVSAHLLKHKCQFEVCLSLKRVGKPRLTKLNLFVL